MQVAESRSRIRAESKHFPGARSKTCAGNCLRFRSRFLGCLSEGAPLSENPTPGDWVSRFPGRFRCVSLVSATVVGIDFPQTGRDSLTEWATVRRIDGRSFLRPSPFTRFRFAPESHFRCIKWPHHRRVASSRSSLTNADPPSWVERSRWGCCGNGPPCGRPIPVYCR